MERRKKALFFVLEENPVYRQLIPLCLATVNSTCDIRVFSSPQDMLSKIQLKPDLLVTEYTFKESQFNGDDVLHSLKLKSPHTDVIFLTANHNPSSAISAIRSGAYEYIPKSKTALDFLIRKSIVLNKQRKYLNKSRKLILQLGLLFIAIIVLLVGLIIRYNFS